MGEIFGDGVWPTWNLMGNCNWSYKVKMKESMLFAVRRLLVCIQQGVPLSFTLSTIERCQGWVPSKSLEKVPSRGSPIEFVKKWDILATWLSRILESVPMLESTRERLHTIWSGKCSISPCHEFSWDWEVPLVMIVARCCTSRQGSNCVKVHTADSVILRHVYHR